MAAQIKQIQFKRSNEAGKRPTIDQLAEGELAINLKDRMLFTRDASGQIIDLGFAKGGNIDGNVVHNGNYKLNGKMTATDIEVTNLLKATTINTPAFLLNIQPKTATQADIDFTRSSWRGETGDVAEIHESFYSGANSLSWMSLIAGELGSWNKNGVEKATLTAREFNIGNTSVPNQTVNLVSNSAALPNLALRSTIGNGNLMIKAQTLNAGSFVDTWFIGKGSTSNVVTFKNTGAGNGAIDLESARISLLNLPVRVEKALGVGHTGHTDAILGPAAVSIGDTKTGFRWLATGTLSHVSDGKEVVRIAPMSTSNVYGFAVKKPMNITATNDAGVVTMPPAEQVLLSLDTSTDNNGVGYGATMIGLSRDGKFHHVFRGAGEATFDMKTIITRGGLDVTGGATIDTATVNGGFRVYGNGHFNNNCTVVGEMNVSRIHRLDKTALVSGDGNINLKFPAGTHVSGFVDGYLLEQLRTKFAEANVQAYPVGAPIPWPSTTVPSGYIAMEGQAITKASSPILFGLYGANLPDMRGQTIKGLPVGSSGRAILSRENDGNKSHAHGGSVASTDLGTKTSSSFDYGSKGTSSFDYGTKTSNTTGAHTHAYTAPTSMTVKDGDRNQAVGSKGNLNTDSSGNHAHTVAIGAHTHSVAIGAHTHTVGIGSHNHGLTINADGQSETTVKNIAFKYIVKIG